MSSGFFPVRVPLDLVLPPLGGFGFRASTVLGAKQVPPVTINSVFWGNSCFANLVRLLYGCVRTVS